MICKCGLFWSRNKRQWDSDISDQLFEEILFVLDFLIWFIKGHLQSNHPLKVVK